MSESLATSLSRLNSLSENELKMVIIEMLAEHNDKHIENDLLQDLVRRYVDLNHKLNDTLLEVEQLSNTDQLTGLNNRHYFIKAFERERRRHQRYGEAFTLIMFDLDHFKLVNDEFGHDVGDEVLKVTAELTKICFRDVDIIARWGGEEFIVLVAGTELEEGLHVAERLRETIALHKFNQVGHKTISLGVSEISGRESMETVIKRADEAMYEAKISGRNRVCYKSKID